MKNLFLTLKMIFSWGSSVPFPFGPTAVTSEISAASLLPLWGSCRPLWGFPSVSSLLGWKNLGTSTAGHRLVIQTLHWGLRLDTLLYFHVLLTLWCSKLYTVLEVRLYQHRAEQDNSFPCLVSSVRPHAPQGVAVPFVCQCKLMTHNQFAVNQNPHIPFCKATLQPLSPSLFVDPGLLCPRCRIQHLLFLNSLKLADNCSTLQFVTISLQGLSALMGVNTSSQLSVIHWLCMHSRPISRSFIKNTEEN